MPKTLSQAMVCFGGWSVVSEVALREVVVEVQDGKRKPGILNRCK